MECVGNTKPWYELWLCEVNLFFFGKKGGLADIDELYRMWAGTVDWSNQLSRETGGWDMEY